MRGRKNTRKKQSRGSNRHLLPLSAHHAHHKKYSRGPRSCTLEKFSQSDVDPRNLGRIQARLDFAYLPKDELINIAIKPLYAASKNRKKVVCSAAHASAQRRKKKLKLLPVAKRGYTIKFDIKKGKVYSIPILPKPKPKREIKSKPLDLKRFVDNPLEGPGRRKSLHSENAPPQQDRYRQQQKLASTKDKQPIQQEKPPKKKLNKVQKWKIHRQKAVILIQRVLRGYFGRNKAMERLNSIHNRLAMAKDLTQRAIVSDIA